MPIECKDLYTRNDLKNRNTLKKKAENANNSTISKKRTCHPYGTE